MNGLVRYISVCTGVGGLDLGFECAAEYALARHARPVLYVEREAYCLAVLARRMAEEALAPAPVWPDLRSIPRRAVDALRGRVDFVVGGIPCQGNSLAGKRLLEADERNLWPDFWHLVRDVGAWGLVIENVAGILVPDRAGGVRSPVVGILGDLAEAGWSAEWTTLPARSVGASHKRERFFLVAVDPMRGPGELRAASGGDGIAHCAAVALGDAQHGGVGRWRGEASEAETKGDCSRGEDGVGGKRVECAGGGVEHAQRARRPAGVRSKQHAERESPDGGAGLAEPGRERSQGSAGPGQQVPGDGAARRGGGVEVSRSLPLFAPGPNDGFWLTVLHERPDLLPALVGAADLDRVRDAGCLPAGREAAAESALRVLADGLAGMDDGCSTRMDQLRCIGNGVVCAQAAAAIIDCFRRLQ